VKKKKTERESNTEVIQKKEYKKSKKQLKKSVKKSK